MIKTAVIPVAGMGTRMLPATKSIPKEMLPLADKPLVHFIVQECVDAGIEHIVFVSHPSKTALENYFHRNFELEAKLESGKRQKTLRVVSGGDWENIQITFTFQNQPLGLGHAVFCAREVLADEPFAVILPDVLLPSSQKESSSNILAEMIYRNQATGASQILVEPVDQESVEKYGVIAGEFLGDENSQSILMSDIVEKPNKNEAPSNLAVVGRYVFNHSIWKHLARTEPGVGGEIQLTDAIKTLIKAESVQGFKMLGSSSDCGNKLGYYKAFFRQVIAQDNFDTSEFYAWVRTFIESQSQSRPNRKQLKLAI
ncbi:UTP--glucose-1-phosphate uridylyltransferase [Aliikangiella marina]|uniref:UTP--glucose-1-phosphate uridylyltransferase n=1 Tax=Aliikangiella marina TaxID=1712262 RepID=A0A545T983_9GAMM|nr:UTP--glucose-1-phosphate uridylyltransferase [Aliikangiella marina]TQV73781.1 UTP--glucose-1-phosphate uridylyltransferase [Aliikangiella marina]